MSRNLFYVLTCLFFIIMIGGATYEHLGVVPRWSMAPPASLSMFQGIYGINPAPFWMMIHPVTLILMVITLILNWKTIRRRSILFPLAGYVIILVITFSYFVPELMAIITAPFSQEQDPSLTERAGLWEMLSIIRLILLLGLAVMLLTGLTKSGDRYA